jgi:hypothetical protein
MIIKAANIIGSKNEILSSKTRTGIGAIKNRKPKNGIALDV